MGILLGLAPFIAFFALMRLVSPLAGLAAGFVVSLLLGVRVWQRGETIKILEIGSLILFAGLTLYTLAVAPAWSVATVRLVVDAGLLAIVLVSLAIGRPFTLQYAREQVPKAFWGAPRFLHANHVITWVWAAALAVLVAADAAAEYVPAIPVTVDVAVSILAIAGAIAFTSWYPAKLRRAAGL
jgi:hypothetical protein